MGEKTRTRSLKDYRILFSVWVLVVTLLAQFWCQHAYKERTCFNIESSQMGADRSITLVGFFVSGIYTPLYTSHEIPRLRENTRMNKKRETALLLTLVAVGRATLRSAVSLPNNPPSALRRAAPGCWRTTPCGWAGYPICCHSRCLCGEEVANENQEEKKTKMATEPTPRHRGDFQSLEHVRWETFDKRSATPSTRSSRFCAGQLRKYIEMSRSNKGSRRYCFSPVGDQERISFCKNGQQHRNYAKTIALQSGVDLLPIHRLASLSGC